MQRSKNCKNAFYYFMLDFRDKNPRKFSGMKAVAEAAGPVWQALNAEQRRPYEARAKSSKGGQKIVKYTATGEKIEVVVNRVKELENREQRINKDIDHTVRLAITNGRLAHEKFHLIHMNYFCLCASNKRYYPAELAVARFTLGEGVTSDDVYHSIVKPGPLPLGYSHQAMLTSKESHQIEPPMEPKEENNLAKVYKDLIDFITETKKGSPPPPLYADSINKPIVENILGYLCAEFGQGEQIEVYPLEYMFFILRNGCSNSAQWLSKSNSRLELEKDKYDFCSDIPCWYHIKTDVPNHCSRSHVIRVAYTICDNCCGDLGIQLIPGRHIPHGAKVPVTRPQSSASNYSSASSVSTIRERNAPRHFGQNANDADDFLSQRTESALSVMSETSSVCDVSDFAALGGHNAELGQTDEWIKPKQKARRYNNGANKPVGSTSTNLAGSTSTNPSGSNQRVTTPSRHPTMLSAGWVDTSRRGGSSQNVPLSIGRGRNIAAKLNK